MRIVLIVAALFMIPSANSVSSSEVKPRMVISPFDYKGVTLNDGNFKSQFDEIKKYYLNIPNEDLLKGFRQRAGLPAPGNDLGGWYTQGTFHVFGQIISGLSRIYAATGDPECKSKVDTLIHEWGKCIREDGYFFAGQPNAPHYIYDKMVGGLVDASKYCHNEEALVLLNRITDWAAANLDRSNAYGYGFSEWYTLSENLYRAYQITGDVKFLNFGRVWEYREYWGIYARKGDILAKMPTNPTYYHAYSHVNTLSGLGAAYQVTGNTWYLRSLRNAYDYLQENQIWPTGGFGPNENLLTKDQLIDTLSTSHNHFETQCGTWAGFKISKYLMSSTGDARYGDWIERLVLNGISASIPSTDDGRVFYYSDYNIDGGEKRHIDIQWSCCTGTRPMAAADFHDIIYFKDQKGIYVNLYTPSTVEWVKGNSKIKLTQVTDFPNSSEVKMKLQMDNPSEFTIKLRIPGWLHQSPTVKINGAQIKAYTNKLHWLNIHRKWHNGDIVTLSLPMKLWSMHMKSTDDGPAAILYGPVVMAVRSSDDNPGSMINIKHPELSFKQVNDNQLKFVSRNNPSITLEPFASFKEHEMYYMFLDSRSKSTDGLVSHMKMKYSDDWSISSIHYSKTPGSTAEYTFDGTGIILKYLLFNDAGKARIEIDGTQTTIIDQYANARDLPASWEIKELSSGRHTIKISSTGEKNPASSDLYINISGLRILP
ncbi:MAG: beta-L-arabinofuranosidase domain-containing protein [Armatimonadota bacterium]